MIKKLFFVCTLMLICNSAFAANWYVDNAAGGLNNGTSWANAWKSFSNVVWGTSGVKAGDILYISGGTTSKTYTTGLRVGASGSSGNPITIKVGQDSGHNGQVIITGGGTSDGMLALASTSYVTVDGDVGGRKNLKLYFTSDGSGEGCAVWADSANYFIIKNIEIERASMAVKATNGNGGVISNCYIHDIRGDAAFRFNSRNGWNNPQYDSTIVEYCDIQLNTLSSGAGNGPDGIQGCPGLTARYNTFRTVDGPQASSTNHMDFLQTQAPYITIIGNSFINSADSAIDFDGYNWGGTADHFRIWNNTFIMTRGCGIRFYGTGGNPLVGLNNVSILNNSFIDHTSTHAYALSMFSFGSSVTVTNTAIKNNIFYNCYTPVYIESSTASQAAYNFDYNLLNAGANGNTNIALDGSSYTQAHPRTGAPLFVAYTVKSTTSDFHLSTSDTAARAQGTDLSAYFTTDKDGNTRTVPWDIGAYGTNVKSGSPSVPGAPQNLRIQ